MEPRWRYLAIGVLIATSNPAGSLWAGAVFPGTIDLYLHDHVWVLPSPAPLSLVCAIATAATK